MSFLATAAIISLVLTFVTGAVKLYVQPITIFDLPSEGELITLGALTVATVASYFATAVVAIVRFL